MCVLCKHVCARNVQVAGQMAGIARYVQFCAEREWLSEPYIPWEDEEKCVLLCAEEEEEEDLLEEEGIFQCKWEQVE